MFKTISIHWYSIYNLFFVIDLFERKVGNKRLKKFTSKHKIKKQKLSKSWNIKHYDNSAQIYNMKNICKKLIIYEVKYYLINIIFYEIIKMFNLYLYFLFIYRNNNYIFIIIHYNFLINYLLLIISSIINQNINFMSKSIIF